MIVPCLAFGMVSSMNGSTGILQVLLSLNPFSPAWATLKAFFLCLKSFKKLWHGNEVDCEDHEIDDVNRLIRYVNLAPFAEAIMESIPQFIIQLYAASVQEEPVKIIQIISLSVSCLSVVWAFTAADNFLHEGEIEVKIKDKVLFFVGNLFFLTSRLLAICYVILGFRHAIPIIVLFHSVVVTVLDCYPCQITRERYMLGMFFLVFRWIRDDLCVPFEEEDLGHRRKRIRRVQWLSHVMFLMENIAMILLFYSLGKFSNTLYAISVTVYVCTASILGSSIRLVHFRFLLKGRIAPETNVTIEDLQAVGLAIQQELMNAFAFAQEWQSAHQR